MLWFFVCMLREGKKMLCVLLKPVLEFLQMEGMIGENENMLCFVFFFPFFCVIHAREEGKMLCVFEISNIFYLFAAWFDFFFFLN